MEKLVLVTGGSRSGKSKFAEGLLGDKEEVLYIATAIITDDEMKERIQKHIDRRKTGWNTYEGYRALDKAIEGFKEKYILLDSVTTMITNIMFEEERDFDTISSKEIDLLEEKIVKEFERLLLSCRERNKGLILVTDEVGFGLVPEYRLGRIFRDIAGSINQFLAGHCDEVYLVACGLPVKLK